MKISQQVADRLAKISYPTTAVKAAISWGVSVDKARRWLSTAKNNGWLINDARFYIPTVNLLRAWREKGICLA